MNSHLPPRRCAPGQGSIEQHNADLTPRYLQRYLNFGLALEELQSGRPIVPRHPH